MKNKKRRKRKKESYSRSTWGDVILQSKPATLVFAALAILMGLFFIFSQSENKPIPRSEAVAYSGEFEEYEVWDDKYRTIHFKDGSSYDVYPHTETYEFQKMMQSLPKGTKLYLLVNPNNDYVAEIRTDTEELMNFESSQEKIDSYDNGYIWIGAFACAAGVFLIVYAILAWRHEKKETARQSKKKEKIADGKDSSALRRTDRSKKGRVLLEITVLEYQICYRRVKNVNELVVNGIVYDEMKAVIEFEHNLCAVIDGHKIEAGYRDKDSVGYSYIRFDGKRVAQKKRLI